MFICVSRAIYSPAAHASHQSVCTIIFSKPINRINVKIREKFDIHHISRPFFSIFANLWYFLVIYFLVFVNVAQFGSKHYSFYGSHDPGWHVFLYFCLWVPIKIFRHLKFWSLSKFWKLKCHNLGLCSQRSFKRLLVIGIWFFSNETFCDRLKLDSDI